VMQFALAYYLEWLPTIGWSKKGAAASAKPGVPAAEPVKMQLATSGKPAMQRY